MYVQALGARVRDAVGGAPRVFRYWDSAHDQSVPVLHSDGRPDPGLTSWSTLGMSHFYNRLRTDDGRALRVELLAVCQSGFTAMGKVLSGCAFNVASGRFVATADVIFPDVVHVNAPSVRMKHALLTTPFLYGLDSVVEDDRVTTWLQLVPVDDLEFTFAREHGVAALTDRFERTQPDVFDLNRPTAL